MNKQQIKTNELTLVFAAKKGLIRVNKVLSKRKGTKYLHLPKIQKTLLGIMLERFENYGKVDDNKTLFGCGFVLSVEEAKAFGYNLQNPIVFTLDTAICSDRITIVPMCLPSEFINNKN